VDEERLNAYSSHTFLHVYDFLCNIPSNSDQF